MHKVVCLTNIVQKLVFGAEFLTDYIDIPETKRIRFFDVQVARRTAASFVAGRWRYWMSSAAAADN